MIFEYLILKIYEFDYISAMDPSFFNIFGFHFILFKKPTLITFLNLMSYIVKVNSKEIRSTVGFEPTPTLSDRCHMQNAI